MIDVEKTIQKRMELACKYTNLDASILSIRRRYSFAKSIIVTIPIAAMIGIVTGFLGSPAYTT